MFLVLQLGADGHYDLANVDPGHCALGLSKGTAHTCLESRLGEQQASHECPLERLRMNSERRAELQEGGHLLN